MQNYFSVFDLAPAFDIDMAALEKRYFDAQRQSHPDRLIGKSAEERRQAVNRSMLVNEAYEALKLPLARARHLLALQGIRVVGEQDSVKPAPALLMEVMESREALEAAGEIEELKTLEIESAKNVREILVELSRVFAARDWQHAAELTLRLGYLLKLEEEIRIKKKGVTPLS